jgi:carboxyl-terminal processing protease
MFKIIFISLIQMFCFILVATPAEKDMKLMDEVLNILQEQYIKDIYNNDFEEAAVKSLMSSLDPHSTYIDKTQIQQIQDTINSSYTGIGIEILNSNGRTVITDVIPNSPAIKAGLKAKDIIIEADGKRLAGLAITEIPEIVNGKIGSLLNLTVMRDNDELEFKIRREKINIQSAIIKLIENDEIAYIRIKNFTSNVSTKVKKSYDALNKSKLKGVIIDLRFNPGGLLEESVNFSSLFMREGMKIVSIKSKNDKSVEDFLSNAADITNGLPIVVIINSMSASAAEIVASALQDHKRAQVLGIKSFGKGSVQTTFPLSNGAAIKLTTSLYYTPNGRVIQNNGVLPNIVVEDGMMVNSINFPDNLSEKALKNNLPANLFNKKEEDMQMIRLYNKKVIGDISSDFQLTRAIDVIQTMIYYKSFDSIT